MILSGCSPFSADEEEELLQQVAEAKFVFFENEWKGISDERRTKYNAEAADLKAKYEKEKSAFEAKSKGSAAKPSPAKTKKDDSEDEDDAEEEKKDHSVCDEKNYTVFCPVQSVLPPKRILRTLKKTRFLFCPSVRLVSSPFNRFLIGF